MKQERQETISKTAADMTPNEFKEYLKVRRDELLSVVPSNKGRWASTYQTRHALWLGKSKVK
jgi:hypothetical protein